MNSWVLDRINALEQRVADLERQLKAAKPARNKRAVAIPDDWQPREEELQWAGKEYPDVPITTEIDRFRDYWISTGTPRKDWDASFRNWIRKAADYSHQSRPPASRVADRTTRIDQGNRDRRARAIAALHGGKQ